MTAVTEQTQVRIVLVVVGNVGDNTVSAAVIACMHLKHNSWPTWPVICVDLLADAPSTNDGPTCNTP